MNRKKAVLHSLLFLMACPLMLIFTAPLARTLSFATMIEVGVTTSILTFGLTLLFLRWDRIHLGHVGLQWTTQTLPRTLIGIAIGAGIVVLQELLIYSGSHTHWTYNHPFSPTRLLLLALTAYMSLGMREELAFRAYPLRRLDHALGIGASLLIIALVFTLEHTAGGWTWSRSLLGPPAGALLFGMAALATRGIAVPLGIHVAFNFGQWLMGQKEIPGLWRPSIDPGFEKQAETLGYAGYLFGMLLAAFGFWLKYRNRTLSPDNDL